MNRTDHERFIHAIAADPSDIPLRLVYADWLDEEGDERGEFLRLLLLASGAESGRIRSWEANTRLSELEKKMDRQWTAIMCRGLQGFRENVARRSFFSQLRCLVWDHEWDEWRFNSSTPCEEVRACQSCNATEVRTQHVLGEWKYVHSKDCRQQQTCVVRGCGFCFTRFLHQWTPWEKISEPCYYRRVCQLNGCTEVTLHHYIGSKCVWCQQEFVPPSYDPYESFGSNSYAGNCADPTASCQCSDRASCGFFRP